ncbi:hypothetical protein [Streptomyces liliifuscus]|uniref:Uncharacterized protein n=1 Tax=Streptomyces liliifuscus TaxID=2797636 RepID=A0A7T7L2B0_9ACTN|nr:hypothetical protein [Streptomyces liliifuscus]QQM45130.1 hypothetical protein JEQ17_40860 [Streptomyces liliifuscus]
MSTRTFTRQQLEAIGIPDRWTATEGNAAEQLHEEQIDTRRWVSVHRLVFRAPDDGIAYAVFEERGLTESQDGTDPWGYADEIKAVEVEERPVVAQQWLPVNTPRDKGLGALLPAWEAVYEPGNVSDYLIGYMNHQDAATGAAEAWMRSQSEVTGRLEWTEMQLRDGDEYDRWFDLVQRHDDGIDTGTGITVRHRTQTA